ncbi:MAG TPA: AbiV family abortive infection protein [Phycisphaerae bacterium]|nr:AbiV family abortive infection protein [Phycisphaerae bacterium]
MATDLSDDEVQSLVNRAVDFFAGPRTPEQQVLYERLEAEADRRRSLAEAFLRAPSAPLELSTLKDGIDWSYENARHLLKDAELLAQHDRSSRCFTLSHCSVEEVGKMAIVHAMSEIPRRNQKLWAWTWKNEFRDHRTKYALGKANLWTDRLYEQLGASFGRDDIEAGVQERLRQLGLYVEFLASDERWGVPEEVTAEMAEDKLEQAQRAVTRAAYYVENKLYAEEYLSLRRDVCGRIYPSKDLPPEKGELRTRWLLDLLKVRQEFFQELVDRGILMPIYHDTQQTDRGRPG